MNKGILAFLGVLIFLFSACQKPKSRTKEVLVSRPTLDSTQIARPEENKPTSHQPVEEKKTDWVTIQTPTFEAVKIRSRVDFSSPTLSQDFPVNFQIRKDSIIWVSVSVGLEVARGIIRQDSIILVDRLNKHVYRFDFSSLSKEIGFPLTYSLVQSLILGDMLIPQRPEDEVIQEENQIVIKQKVESLAIESVIDRVKQKLVRLAGSQTNSQETLDLIYPKFQETSAGLFPAVVQVKIQNPEKTDVPTRITMEHQRIEWVSRDLRYPFSVPKNYTEKQLKP